MTATMPKTNLKPLNVRKVMLASAITLLAVLLIVGGVLLLSRHSTDEPVVDLEQVQNDLVQELTDRHGEYDERSIVLTGTNKVTAKKLAEKLGADLRITSDGSFATLTLPEGMTFLDVAQAEKYLNDLPKMSVDYEARISEIVEENEGVNSERLPMRPQYTVTDGSYELQTYLDYLNMRNLWSYTRGNDITVAIIDTGIDTDHPEFAGRISEYSYNASEDKIVKDYKTKNGSYDWSLIEDEQGHGTSVAGVIGASMDSGEIVGIAPQVTLLVIKAECDEYGNFKRTSDLVFGLYYAIERDVNVVNMSFGGYGLNPYAEAAQLAVDSDIICVAAAGNDATADLCYPAADENVFGIGALAADSWELADYSNYGENVDFVAPGTTFTTKMGGGYATTNGTSLACPTAVGVIALYLSENKYQEVDFVEELLRASCYDLGDLGPDWYYGYGAIDAYALIKEERGTVTFNMMTDELDNTTQTFIRNHTLQDMPEPERLYAVFDGWYRDPQCTNEYRWYEDKFSTDLTLYANWVNEDDGVPYIYVELDDGTIEIRAYTGHRRYITIPDYIDGKVVSSIGEGAFAGETNLREVNLPKYLVRIRDRAFMGCSNLVSMSILDTVAEIGAHAFYDNIRLSSVAFGENSQLTTIGNFAFKGCGKLRNFTVPKNVTILNGSAFYGDTSMQSFAVQEGSETFFALDGVLLNHTMTTAVAYPAGRSGEYTLPTSIKTVGDYAFAFAKISQVDLANVQTIGNAAFIYSRLETLNIPDSVTQMGEKAFASCQYLKVLTLGHGLTEISNSAFYKCSMLQSVEIPNTIQIIGDGAFAFASLQQGLTFEENSSLIVIGSEAFRCTDILSVRIPASVVSIGDVAFAGSCSSNLASVVFEKGSNLQRIGGSAFQKTMIAEIILPNRLEQIGEFAFSYTKLKTVTLPASLTLLGEGAFASCHSLENIFVEDANAVYTDVDGVVYDTSKTTLVEYPAGNTRTQYTVLDGVVTIGKAAFYGTTNIQTVNLPDSVKVLDEYSFYDCSAQQYQLSSNLQEIKMYALSKNKHLTSIAIPDSVMQISNYAFAEDWRLRSVTFTEKSKLPRISFGAFAYCGLQSFRVPANVSTMAQGAFLGCPDLKSFTFAKNSKLESISAYMFDGCSNLQSITFEQGSALTSIQAHGMEGMTKLRNIDLGDAKLTNIDNFAFRFCESLTHVDIPEGVTNLGRYAFYYCTSLSEIQIPSTMEHIGRFAFLGTEEMNVYFASETLPQYLDEDWDHDIAGYYLGVTDVITDGDWKYAKLTSGGIAIIEYLGEATEIDLTALDLGGDIVSIGGKAFYFSMVESIKLPETLVTIQANAFYHSALKSITIPESVQFIGREAFAYTPITSLTFADNSKLTVMEQSAFENTEELGSVVLPKSLTTIGRAIFKNSGITSLTFEKGIAITEISEEAFAYTNIKTLIIPDDITLINHNAFRNTAQLEGVSFGSADFMVMSNAFYQSGLKSLHIPANMTYVGELLLLRCPI
ncbi:MAG: leucine-rich repeat protein [Clostridia bacterium]|nr:leucine-rich repeat protein [Clostridia bacterium]